MIVRTILAIALGTAAVNAADGWTGWSVGVHGGYGIGTSPTAVDLGGQWRVEPTDVRNSFSGGWGELDPAGALAGVQIGYGRQFGSGVVVGGDLDYSLGFIDDEAQTGPRTVPSAPSLSYDSGTRIEVDHATSLRASLGWSPAPRHLLWLTAGYGMLVADGAVDVVSNGSYRKAGGDSDLLHGIAYGLGYALRLDERWALRAEFLRYDVQALEYDTAYQPGSSFVSPAYTERVRQDVDLHVLRLGLDWRL